MGVDAKGRRQLLATDVVHEENQADYEALLEGLKQRGVERVDLLIGDAHQGLQAAFARTCLTYRQSLALADRNIARTDQRSGMSWATEGVAAGATPANGQSALRRVAGLDG